MNASTWWVIALLMGIAIFPSNDCTLSRSDRKKKTKKAPPRKIVEEKYKGPLNETVYERDLVTSGLKWPQEVIENHQGYSKQTSFSNFDGHVLGYITPWNNHGYKIAKIFAKKFSSISPVWLQVVPDGDNYKILGTHDVDQKWVGGVKKKNANIKVLPRLLFDKFTGQDYGNLFRSQLQVEKLIAKVLEVIKTYNFNGIVLEVWSQLGGQAKDPLTKVIIDLSEAVSGKGKTFVLVIPPPVYAGNRPGMFDKNDLENLADHVDYFSLMTYDYSNPQRPGPNSPMTWIKQCILLLDPDSDYRKKILLGLNFYGNAYTPSGGGPILGRDFVKLLKEAVGAGIKPDQTIFMWDETSQEHFIELRQDHLKKSTVFYPSLNSIQSRLLVSKEFDLGGVAIWEIGQGLDYFYDLL